MSRPADTDPIEMNLLKLYDGLIRRSAFPKVSSFENELKKAALLRILIGIVVFIRFAEIAYSIPFMYKGNDHLVFSYLSLVLIFCFTVGLFTPVVSVVMLFYVNFYDMQMETETLGTAVLAVTLIPLTLVNSGQYYSLDRLLFYKNQSIQKVISTVYSFVGARNVNDITRVYFLGFTIYALISFGALALHIQDPYWTSGLTVKTLLVNSYLCKQYEFFRMLDQSFPQLLSALSIMASIF